MSGFNILFVNPGDRKEVCQGLGDEFCAIEPPVFAGLFATYAQRQGLSCAIRGSPGARIVGGADRRSQQDRCVL